MQMPDLNLLVTLDVLLEEGSVARAARRLRLSASAMSRALARLRETTGDPLLVRAGRGLVPTPRALELRSLVGPIVLGGCEVLRPVERLDPARLVRTFTLRSSEGFAETFGPDLVARVSAAAPGVKMRFVQKPDKDSALLRTGAVDLETGVIDATTSPELRTLTLFRDGMVGAVRMGNALSRSRVTLARYLAGRHVSIAREGADQWPVTDALRELGEEREVGAIVTGFATALSLARGTDLIASVPDRHTRGLREGMHSFALPFATPEITVSLLWHPRMDADAAHRWLRECVRDVCRAARD